MVKIFAILQVRDFPAFEAFERKASKIMADYNGKIVSAFETVRHADGAGEEVHVVEFQCEEDFTRYKSDPRFQTLADLRAKAISGVELKVALAEKSYS